MTVDEASDSRQRTRVLSVGGGAASLERPLNPPLPPRQGHGQIKDEVEGRVAELAEAGALDAGNGDVLDGWIETLVPQWHAHQAVESTEREALAQLNTGRARAALTAARTRAEAAEKRVEDATRLFEQVEERVLVRTEAAPGKRERRRRQRPRIDRLDGLMDKPSSGRGNKVLLGLAAVGDLVTFYMTLADLLGENPVVTVLLVVAFTAASLGLTHAIGRSVRNLREGQGGLGRGFIALALASWALLGGVACYVRARVVPVEEGFGEATFGGDSDAAALTAADTSVLAAALLAGLFLASGVLAFWIGFSEHRPRMQTYLLLRTQLEGLRIQSSQAHEAVAAAEVELVSAEAEELRVFSRGQAASGSREAEIRELKALVRVLIAKHLGSPAATNALTSKRSGQPADDDRPAGDSTEVFVVPPRPPLPPGAIPVPR